MNKNIKTTPEKNNKTFYIFKFLLCAFLYFILFTSNIMCAATASYAKTKNASTPKFENKYDTIYIGSSYKYSIINLPQNTTIKFIINNKTLAKLNSKTGLLIPKKKGNLTLKAVIKNTNKKNNLTLTKKITIKDKLSPENTEELLSAPTHINSINFTVRLRCARIMQQSQVENSSISLHKDTYIAMGDFKSLSDDGRYITYELNSQSIKLLSPGDSSMDGTYQLSCTLSQKKYSISYIEHMLGQSVTGFIFDKAGNALENASVTLTNNNITVTTRSDKNGYYIIRFPKAENVTMCVSCKDYIDKSIDNVCLKLTKSLCKNIILHNDNSKNSSSTDLAAFFKINDADNEAKKIEITTVNSDTSDKSHNLTKTFFTDISGNLLLSNNNNINISQTDADIINISDNINTLSHTDMIKLDEIKKEIFNFSYNQNYYIKIYSDNNGIYLLKNEFTFSFNDFISDHIIFNISLNTIEKTSYPDSLLPITTGSNISYDKINYYNASLYRIGTDIPICSFSFYENTPADFKNQIDNMNLYLKNGNLYYAVFQIYDYYNKELFPSVLYRFKVKNSKIYFENNKIEFNSTFTTDNRFSILPEYKNTITNVSILPQDTTYLNTVLCCYNNYGGINKTILTSLSSQLLQYELSNAESSYTIYTNNSEFFLPIATKYEHD